MKNFCIHPKRKVHGQDLTFDGKFTSGVIQKESEKHAATAHSNKKGGNSMTFHNQF